MSPAENSAVQMVWRGIGAGSSTQAGTGWGVRNGGQGVVHSSGMARLQAGMEEAEGGVCGRVAGPALLSLLLAHLVGEGLLPLVLGLELELQQEHLRAASSEHHQPTSG